MNAHRFDHRPGTILLTFLFVLTAGQALATDSNSRGTIGLAIGHLDFGTVVIGESVTLPNRISNNTSSAVTIDSIQGIGPAFQVTGINVPMVLGAGQSAAFSVRFQPKHHDNHTTTIAFGTQSSVPSVALIARGIGVYREKLSADPSPVSFANLQVGSHQTSTVTLTNDGGRELTIKQATLSGGVGFAMSNLALPLTLKSGQTTTFTITFAPTRSGYFSGQVSFATVTNDHAALTSTLVLGLFGSTGSPAGLVFSPSSLAFGNVQVGSNSSQTETLTNLGGASVTISQATASGAGFSLKGPTLPMTLTAGQSAAFKVLFSPTASGAVGGSVNITSTDANPNLNIPISGTGMAAGSLNANPNKANFGNVTVGSNQTMPVTVANTGGEAVTLSSAAASGGGFKLPSQNLPITLNAGQSTTLNVVFAPLATGAASGALTINSDASNGTVSVPLSGMAVAQGQLGSSPSSFTFGNIQVGTSKSLTGTLTNSGGTSLTISAAAAGGSGFSLSGLTLPLTLGAGQSTSFTVLFSPTGSGAASGSVSVTSTGSDSSLSIPLSGAGVTAGTVAANPVSLAFGSVPVSGSASLSETLTNTGGSSLTISAAAASGTGFSLSGLTLPLTLNAGQSTSFTVLFSPTASAAASGNVSITSNGSNPNLSIPLSGTGVAATGSLTSNPTSLAFGSIQVSGSANLSETVTNTGGASVTISQAGATGAGFSISGLTLPLTLTANQSVTFTTTFAPTGEGAASGTLSVVSNASNSPLNIALSGTGTAAGQLAVSPTNLSFGNVTVGSNASLNGTLTASGAAVKVTSAGIDNGEFAVSGISLPVTIAAGQSASFSVRFTPQASGAVSASLSFSSNAANSATVQTMTGTGAAAVQHSVDLNWNSSSDAVGYNVYRGTASGGPFTMINSTLDSTTSYSDDTVVSGQTYFYVATAVDSNSNESAYSTQTKAVIPNP